MHVVICGGGVIGACCAYFLARKGARVTVVERTAVAAAASGKSGGFLALDWNDNSPLAALARRSYRLHEQLAGDGRNNWGFRYVETLSIAASATRDLSGFGRGSGPEWLSVNAAVASRLGGDGTTGQVHPARFTSSLMAQAQDAGASLVIGTVDGFDLAPGSQDVRAVWVDGERLPAGAVVIALGPWSGRAANWLPLPHVHGIKGNCVVFRPETEIGAHALFTDVELRDGQTLSLEIYPRPDGTVYVCGLSGTDQLAEDPAVVAPDAGAAETIAEAAAVVVPALAGSEIIAEQACHRPVVHDGLPLIGGVTGVAGAFVATGHSVWGILNAPATGEAIAQLVTEGTTTLDLTAFDPNRFP